MFDPFTIKQDDVVELDGIKFSVDELNTGVFLTTLDSDVVGYNNSNDPDKSYYNYIKHFRYGKNERAVMSRHEMQILLDFKTYYIG